MTMPTLDNPLEVLANGAPLCTAWEADEKLPAHGHAVLDITNGNVWAWAHTPALARDILATLAVTPGFDSLAVVPCGGDRNSYGQLNDRIAHYHPDGAGAPVPGTEAPCGYVWPLRNTHVAPDALELCLDCDDVVAGAL